MHCSRHRFVAASKVLRRIAGVLAVGLCGGNLGAVDFPSDYQDMLKVFKFAGIKFVEPAWTGGKLDVVGTWDYKNGNDKGRMSFRADGSFSWDGKSADPKVKWKIEGDFVVVRDLDDAPRLYVGRAGKLIVMVNADCPGVEITPDK